MNTQTNQEKRTIKVKDFLDDFRAGMSDPEMLKKYHLTPAGLDKFHTMLLTRGIIEQEELHEHYKREELREKESVQLDSASTSYICPCCLASQETMFDICPNCGVSFQELISIEKPEPEPAMAAQSAQSASETSAAPAPEPKAAVQPPIEIPMADFIDREFAESKQEPSEFLAAEDLDKDAAAFEEPDDIVAGTPLDYIDENDRQQRIQCDSCHEDMEAGLRDVYDHRRAKLAFIIAAGLLAVGFFGTAALGYMDGFSFVRLLVVYATGMSLLFGAVFSAVGAFMTLARERVFYCSYCGRVYPRG
jgi:hypothetical protein